MLRHVLIGIASAALAGALFVPDEALARGGVRGGGGFHGGGVRAAGIRGGHISRPIARPGAGVVRGAAVYRGGVRRGAVWGAGAAAVGAGAYYGSGYYNNCYRDAYGQTICPNQYQDQY
jgi:hypothetical protein